MNTTSATQENQAVSSANEVAFLPLSLLSTSRREFYDGKYRKPEERSLQLTVKAGLTEELTELPADLTGSMFLVAPAGVVDSHKVEGTDTILPTKDGWTHLLNGDGMVYRFDFGRPNPQFSCRLMSNVSYYADKITHQKYPLLKFINYGLARSSPLVGGSNQANTALLKLPGIKGQPERLFVTADVERPLEIDPVSLRIIAPVGLNQDWEEPLKLTLKNRPNKPFLTASHPVVIPDSNELITVNLVRSLWEVMGVDRILRHNSRLFASNLTKGNIAYLATKACFSIVEKMARIAFKLLEKFQIATHDDVFLIRWNGENNKFEKWKVMLADGSSIDIHQSVHELGITKDYIVFADTAFKAALSSLLPTKESLEELSGTDQSFYEWVQSNRQHINFPLLSDTRLFIISRHQLDEVESGGVVIAQEALLKDAAIAHYSVDFDNEDDKITLHAASNQKTDFAEFIHEDDQAVRATTEKTARMRQMLGTFSGALEVNRPITYVIDALTGNVCNEATIPLEDASEHTWSMSFYTCQSNSSTDQYDDMYWSVMGAWPEIISDRLIDLYYSKEEQKSPKIKEFIRLLNQGRPNSICRIHIDRTQKLSPALSVADSYQFPHQNRIAYFGHSPQFIPRPDATNPRDGYLTCSVNYSDQACSHTAGQTISHNSWSANSEIWIFDANNLNQGPLYRLSHAQLNFCMTLHAEWLEKIVSPSQQRKYDVRKDYEDFVAHAVQHHSKKKPYEARQINQLFQEIFSEIEREQREANL